MDWSNFQTPGGGIKVKSRGISGISNISQEGGGGIGRGGKEIVDNNFVDDVRLM